MGRYRVLLPTTEPSERRRTERTTASPRDAELFGRFFEGDDSAMVELFDRHNYRLYLFCYQYVNGRQQAEDITQEIWERMIRMRADGNRPTLESPMGLLLTIARNMCIDALRRSRNHSDLAELPESNHPAASIPELSHLEELVILALPHLPTHQREVLALNAYSGYRFEEIAEMLGEPVGAIRTRAWRARVHLGRIIAALAGVEEDTDPRNAPNLSGDGS